MPMGRRRRGMKGRRGKMAVVLKHGWKIGGS
jgi:hypothetical protein